MKNRACEVCGNSKQSLVFSKKENKLLCNTHYAQVLRYGKILCKTIKSPNDVLECDDYCEIILRDIKLLEVGRAVIDKEDLPTVNKHIWHLNSNGYAATNTESGYLRLHRLVMDAEPNDIIDHKNRNKLDNRKSNLRFVDSGFNRLNLDGVKGVKNNRGHWESCIWINKKYYWLGQYDTYEKAVSARMKAEKVFQIDSFDIKHNNDIDFDGLYDKHLKPKDELYRSNTSGFRGVTSSRSKGEWEAYIDFHGKRYSLGAYGTPEEAFNARLKAEDDIKNGNEPQFETPHEKIRKERFEKIKLLLKTGMTQRDIGKEIGVSQSEVSRMKKRLMEELK